MTQHPAIEHLTRASRDLEQALAYLPGSSGVAHNRAIGDVRRAGQDLISRARRLVIAQTVSDNIDNPHTLDRVARHIHSAKGVTLTEIADEFTGGNLVVARRVLDVLEKEGFVIWTEGYQGNNPVTFWKPRLHWPAPAEEKA